MNSNSATVQVTRDTDIAQIWEVTVMKKIFYPAIEPLIKDGFGKNIQLIFLMCVVLMVHFYQFIIMCFFIVGSAIRQAHNES